MCCTEIACIYGFAYTNNYLEGLKFHCGPVTADMFYLSTVQSGECDIKLCFSITYSTHLTCDLCDIMLPCRLEVPT